VVRVSVSGTFLNTLKFQVKDCDPTTGEPDSDVGYADEYVVSIVYPCITEQVGPTHHHLGYSIQLDNSDL